ncbi:unnamed protein product, partial [marine sediment metagenome]
MAEKVNYYATGRRKNSTAKVRLIPGEGKIIVNQKDFKEYFKREALTAMIVEPLKLTNTESAYDIVAQLLGGGISGQAGALRHGISRALLEINGEFRDIL